MFFCASLHARLLEATNRSAALPAPGSGLAADDGIHRSASLESSLEPLGPYESKRKNIKVTRLSCLLL